MRAENGKGESDEIEVTILVIDEEDHLNVMGEDDSSDDSGADEPSQAAPQPQTLTIVSGDGQQGPASTQLAEPFEVSVSDQNGDPLPGATVTFEVTAGGATLSATTATTDASGRAASTLTLGGDPGRNTVAVRVAELKPVIFSATGQNKVPTSLTKVSGHKQEGPAGAALSEPLVVEIRDQINNPFEGVQVTFAVTAGGGTLSATTYTTDAKGRAASTLVLGSQPGTNTVLARVAKLNPVSFIATGQAIPKTLTKVSGDGKQGAPATQLADPFVVSVLDQTGAAFPGATVTFAVTTGGGTLSATTAATDANGLAAATLTLGSQPETVTVVAIVASLDPVTFTATAKATPDFDGDGKTGFSDFFLFADHFGGSDPRFDLDGSGSVDFRRLLPPGRPLRRSGPGQAAGPRPADDRLAGRPAAFARTPPIPSTARPSSPGFS